MRAIYLTISLLLVSLYFTPAQAQTCWSPLGAGLETPSGYTFVGALQEYNGKLIAAGSFDTMGGNAAVNNIAAWDGSTWSALGQGIKLPLSSILGHESQINAMTIYNGALYVCGSFDSAGGVPASCIAKWDGSTWSSLGSGIKLQRENQQLFTMAVYNNDLYVGGLFDSAGGVATTNIAKWDGGSWSAVGAGLGVAGTSNTSDSDIVASLFVYNNTLVAGGYFNVASSLPVSNIAAWNGSAWSALGSGVINGVPQSMCLNQNELYASSSSQDNSGNSTYFITKWDGSSWTNVVGGPGTGANYYGYPPSLLSFNGYVLAAGRIGILNNNDTLTTAIAQWNGSTWSQFVGMTTPTDGCYPMVIYNSHLYTGGEFSQIGGTNAMNVAEYTCLTSGIKEIKPSAVSIYPNPNKGQLTISISDIKEQSEITIYNLLGEEILKASTTNIKTELDLKNQASGVYLYHITSESGDHIASGSFIIE